ncbi:hypothetical protein [uncultured Tateyamaria sp.]|uniref:hypothetical protein n=1 Tax=uncultured Tateyamaria sp. TaxID=455651 RepID=UPI00260D176B|nr:hypothetical protein [uncultured Tateyamaria sp.]
MLCLARHVFVKKQDFEQSQGAPTPTPDLDGEASSSPDVEDARTGAFKFNGVDWLDRARIRAFVLDNLPMLIVLTCILCAVTLAVVFWSEIITFLGYIVAALFGMFGLFLAGYFALAALIAVLSVPFVLVLSVYGAFQHPKALNTVRVGRALLVTGFIVILGGIYADALEASFAYGALNLSEEIVRGYSWVAVGLLLFAYFRALYGEGLSAYTAGKEIATRDRWRSLLLQPAFLLNAFLFDLVVPLFVSLSILISFRCEGLYLAVEVWTWMVAQFAFVTPSLWVWGEYLSEFEVVKAALILPESIWSSLQSFLQENDIWQTVRNAVTPDPRMRLLIPWAFLPGCT